MVAEIGIDSQQKPTTSSGWTIAILCIGLSLIAACVIIPQADANRRLVYEREKLRLDLQQIQKQVALNQDFLHKIETDPQLAERVARRQMRVVRQGETVLDLQSDLSISPNNDLSSQADRMSPFMIVKVPPPPPLVSYKPLGGLLARLCLQSNSQLYILCLGLFLAAAGLILGDTNSSSSTLNRISSLK